MLILPHKRIIIPNDPQNILGLTRYQIQQMLNPFNRSGNSAHI